ncbi:MAG: GUN4 N-terminal ARM-like repeat domain-containing protein [Xenococcaceae cyanobacterium]
MTDQQTASVQDYINDISQLASQFQSESEKNQLQLIPKLVSAGEPGWAVLREFLLSHQSVPANLVVGKVYQALYQANSPKTQEFLQTYFPSGVIPLKSERNIDYQPLQHLLVGQDFQAADSLTRQKLCELAGEAALKRKWLYFTEVEKFPLTDLHTINQLWWIHSEGKFGFSVQRQIWLSLGKDFSKLWPKIGWKTDKNWTQYPNEFTWDLSAPKGHLPLSNQLRGVRVIASLFSHPVWSKTDW